MDKVKDELGQELKSVNDDLADLRKRVVNNEANLDKKIEAAIMRMSGGDMSNISSRDRKRIRPLPVQETMENGRTPAQEDRYWRCRRSLCLWPVRGTSLEDAVRAFMSGKLLVDEAVLAELPNCTIRAVKPARS